MSLEVCQFVPEVLSVWRALLIGHMEKDPPALRSAYNVIVCHQQWNLRGFVDRKLIEERSSGPAIALDADGRIAQLLGYA